MPSPDPADAPVTTAIFPSRTPTISSRAALGFGAFGHGADDRLGRRVQPVDRLPRRLLSVDEGVGHRLLHSVASQPSAPDARVSAMASQSRPSSSRISSVCCPSSGAGPRGTGASPPNCMGGAGRRNTVPVVRRHLRQVAVGHDLHVVVDLGRVEHGRPDAGEGVQLLPPFREGLRAERRLELGHAGLGVLGPGHHVARNAHPLRGRDGRSPRTAHPRSGRPASRPDTASDRLPSGRS